jgi:hypothetical protein
MPLHVSRCEAVHIFVRAAWCIIADMLEIFCKTDDRHGSLEEQEYFEIRLIDLSTNAKPRFLIREIHTVWSDRARQVMWNGHENHTCRTPDEAQKCFNSRRGFILAKGFTFTGALAVAL